MTHPYRSLPSPPRLRRQWTIRWWPHSPQAIAPTLTMLAIRVAAEGWTPGSRRFAIFAGILCAVWAAACVRRRPA